MGFINTLKLTQFRCYGAVALEGLSSGMIVLSGHNGAGKTNILEAISLLSPGRGLRGAKAAEIQKKGASEPWAVSGVLQTQYEQVRLGTGLELASPDGGERRTVKIDGKMQKGQAAFARYMSCVWLTPQMDRLFLDSGRERRLFLDRLVFSFDPGHAGRITRYENAMAQRSKLLREGKADDLWLSGLEQDMAETSVAIAAARLEFVQRLQKACEVCDSEFFPQANFHVQGVLEERLASQPALEVEDFFKNELARGRPRDAVTGGAATGAHKSDLVVYYAAKAMHAAQCSTGEQKALLIGLVLAHVRLIKAEQKITLVLLLDEVAAHLDEMRREELYKILEKLGVQVWLTGTDQSLFDAVKGKARFFRVEKSEIF